MLLPCFKSVSLLCKCKLSFKFVLIPKIKVSTFTSKSKVKKLYTIIMHRKKTFSEESWPIKVNPPIKVTPFHGTSKTLSSYSYLPVFRGLRKLAIAWMGYSRKNPNRGMGGCWGWGYKLFWKKHPANLKVSLISKGKSVSDKSKN